MDARTVNDRLREHVATIGDKDFWLSRKDAAVVCRAISLSLPMFSRQGFKSRICAVLCRFTRLGDRWMNTLSSASVAASEPVSFTALKHLRTKGSARLFADVRAEAEVTKVFRKDQRTEALEIVVDTLYSALSWGINADRLRARIRKDDQNRLIEAKQREKYDALAKVQRALLDE
ncbi:hypothetical protein [Burkholderia sp. Ac-20365]|uniref:hypothetical protein n=1 Tax=Burkholderia sp. Ac-20365 TaxID=2703897 RepID=UPI00197B5AE6|nr:hypothetical protein [Burkholderia sp. Ac-20365]MBN3761012.1 hypothetical protein [Burkholderia sp. Ac-20365]